MKNILFTVLLLLPVFIVISQENASKVYPFESGKIVYEYSGQTEGSRTLYISAFGDSLALHTNLERSSTFYAITTNSQENVEEYFIDGKHYHFDLEQKRGMLLNNPFHLLDKYMGNRKTAHKYQEVIEQKGGQLKGNEEILGLDCEHWKFRNKEFWIWEGLLLKVKSEGVNKNFEMTAVKMLTNEVVSPEIFHFPEDISLK